MSTPPRFSSRILLLLALIAIGLRPVQAQPAEVPFDSSAWNLEDAVAAEVVEHRGQQSLYLEGGAAWLEDVAFTDGTIEFDTAMPGERGFVGVRFRAPSDEPGGWEDVYVRLHKSGSPDAVQYTPAFNGANAWQFYGQGQGWGTATFDKEGWVPVRLEVASNRVRVFVGDTEEPNLEARLRRDERSGRIGVWAGTSEGVYLSNFRHTPQAPTEEDLLAQPETPPGTLARWEITPAFLASERDLSMAPDTAALSWTSVTGEPDGLLNLSRFLDANAVRPQDGPPGPPALAGTYVRATVYADEAQTKKLLFGYSDNAVVYLNGQPLFAGQAAFRSRSPLFQGMLGLNDALYLDLEEGANELVFALTEIFGGWGLKARFEDPSGIRLESTP